MRINGLLIALVALGMATEARAQWDAPSFMPPRPGDDVGIYLTDYVDFGIHGIWRQQGNLNLGLRLGYIDGFGDGALAVGAESWDLMVEGGADFPVDVGWTLGAGAVFNGGTRVEIPVGLTLGRVLDLDPVSLQVYGHPRLGLFIAPEAANDEVALKALFDLGVDAMLQENLKLRIGATMGYINAVGIGLAVRWTRGAVVR